MQRLRNRENRTATLWSYFKIFQSRIKDRERIPKEVVEKYENSIGFMVDKDQCHMEEIEPRTVCILPMGYEVDAQKLEVYAQHLMSKLVDSNEPRFVTFKEKDVELHEKFTQPTRKRKVSKIV